MSISSRMASNSNSNSTQPPPRTEIVIDGSHGEGGGQIVRNAISLACILKKPLRIINIRSNRKPKPGLQAQHMIGLQLCANMSGGTLTGCQLGSQQISYHPPPPTTNNESDTNNNKSKATNTNNVITGDTQTAGSICLLLQAALPVALFSSNNKNSNWKLILKGGTNATFAPQYDYWDQVFLPILQRHFLVDLTNTTTKIHATVVRRGYFPLGGGHVEVDIQPLSRTCRLSPITLVEPGGQGGDVVSHISIRSYYAGNSSSLSEMATEMNHAAFHEFQKKKKNFSSSSTDATIESTIVRETNAVGSGYGILLVAETTTGCRLAGSALGKTTTTKQQAYKNKRKHFSSSSSLFSPGTNNTAAAAAVGRKASKELLDTLKDGGCVDEWLQDQLILYMALADGTSKLLTGSLTLHTQTAIWVAERMSNAKFVVKRLRTTEEDDDNNNDGGGGVSSSSLGSSSASGYYGKGGRIPGKHLISCTGIGFCPDDRVNFKKGRPY